MEKWLSFFTLLEKVNIDILVSEQSGGHNLFYIGLFRKRTNIFFMKPLGLKSLGMLLLLSADFFQNLLFSKILSGTLSECQNFGPVLGPK